MKDEKAETKQSEQKAEEQELWILNPAAFNPCF
jgi:hypothetical protein